MTVTAALILAAGRGTRAGGATPKQWRVLAGKSVARRTLEKFREFSPLVLVIHPEDEDLARSASAGLDVTLVTGGADRRASVRRGLDALAEVAPDRVLIHDVARPCVTAGIIADICAALDTCPAAAPGLAVTDALWTGAEGRVTGLQPRDGLFRAQTPQGFHFAAIRAAHDAFTGDAAADDVAVARAAGLDVAIVPGAERNLKITTPEDFDRAVKYLEAAMQVRVGNGFDVHRLVPGDHVTLCGVRVPHDHALSGHSDADVGMHALTDAIYGALAEGDIGRHFPPSDPQWKGAASAIFLRHAVGLARDRGFEIGNVDVTLICEAPKITPHAAAMTEALSAIMEVPADRVSVKATTTERLGFAGRGEGIAAQASATLVAS